MLIKNLSDQAMKIFDRLAREYPSPKTALSFQNPLELLVATILSAQCTDVRVNQVTKTLFQQYGSAQDFAQADLGKLEDAVRPTGFFHNKAKAIKACCQEILERHGGKVPGSMDALTKLTGVGRKTANVILGNAFGIPGIVVDTHVKRLSQRMGLTRNSDPVKIEFDLMALLPEERWTPFSHLLIFHGRNVCVARKPKHASCCLSDICPSANL